MNVTARVVSFEHNSLVHVTPFPRIVVEKLILRRNRIARIDYHAFKELVNLTELDLSHNQLTSMQLQPHIFEVIKTISRANALSPNEKVERTWSPAIHDSSIDERGILMRRNSSHLTLSFHVAHVIQNYPIQKFSKRSQI